MSFTVWNRPIDSLNDVDGYGVIVAVDYVGGVPIAQIKITDLDGDKALLYLDHEGVSKLASLLCRASFQMQIPAPSGCGGSIVITND